MVTSSGNVYCKLDSNNVADWLYCSEEDFEKNFEIERVIEKVASIFHENWRKSRLNENGIYCPMIEKVEDEKWVREYWTNVVDIANTKFEDLPDNWKNENFEAAKIAVDLVYEKVVNWEEITSEEVEGMSRIIHEKRLKRNWIQWSFENQRVDYDELSEEEKSKDRVQIETAIQIIKSVV